MDNHRQYWEFIMRRWLLTIIFFIPEVIHAIDQNNIKEYKLDNGLKVIVKEDHRAPVVFSSIWYKVGSSYEPNGLTGISHALEHMMFRGTTQYGPGKLSQIINAHGGEQNAMTSNDFTVYYQSLPADKLALSLELEADRMTHLTLNKDDFANEIQVVMEERRMRTEDNPQALTLERFNAIAFINNPYHHPVVGWMSDLQQMTIENLRDWYAQWYVPNNAILLVIGDVNPENVFKLAKKYFGNTAAKPLPPVKAIKEISSLGQRQIHVHIPAQLPWVVLGYQTPSLTTDPQSNDPYALTLIAYLVGGGESSRLNKHLIRGQQIASHVGASYALYNLYDNLFLLSATPSKKTTTEDLKKALLNEVLSLQKDLVSPDELSRAKALLIAEHVFGQDSLSTQAINLGLPEVTGLSWHQENEFISRIENITAQQIRTAAKRYLTPENLTIGYLEPHPKNGTPLNQGFAHENSIIH